MQRKAAVEAERDRAQRAALEARQAVMEAQRAADEQAREAEEMQKRELESARELKLEKQGERPEEAPDQDATRGESEPGDGSAGRTESE
jgi:hypothetical protein